MRQGPHAAERSARLRSRGCWASPLVLLLAAACGPDLNGATHVTSRMRIHTSFEAGLCTGDLVDLERYVGSVEMLLGVEMDAPVEVYLWDSFLIPEGCGAERTGCYRRGAHAVYATFDSIYHELAHAVTASLGRPDDFFLEGIAAALDGKISRNSRVRVLRSGLVLHTGAVKSLKRFKDDVREVAAGYECGAGLDNFNDLQVGDQLEFFYEEEVART